MSSLLLLQPCYLRDWEMQVHFKIHGQGKKNLNGDGFAIWYTKDRMQPGKAPAVAAEVEAVPRGEGVEPRARHLLEDAFSLACRLTRGNRSGELQRPPGSCSVSGPRGCFSFALAGKEGVKSGREAASEPRHPGLGVYGGSREAGVSSGVGGFGIVLP